MSINTVVPWIFKNDDVAVLSVADATTTTTSTSTTSTSSTSTSTTSTTTAEEFQYIYYDDNTNDLGLTVTYTDGATEVRKRQVISDYHIDITITIWVICPDNFGAGN